MVCTVAVNTLAPPHLSSFLQSLWGINTVHPCGEWLCHSSWEISTVHPCEEFSGGWANSLHSPRRPTGSDVVIYRACLFNLAIR